MVDGNLNEMAHRILDSAEQFTQTRGFNGFSYKDIQGEVGVKTSSIHYYFPTKQDLAHALANRYVERFLAALTEIDRREDNGLNRLQAMGQLFVQVARAHKLCLCGMLISDVLSVPQAGFEELRRFVKETEKWIIQNISKGMKEGDLNPSLKPKIAAAHLLAALEGGVLIARVRNNDDYLEEILSELLSQLAV